MLCSLFICIWPAGTKAAPTPAPTATFSVNPEAKQDLEMGLAYLHGRFGLPRDTAKAAPLLEIAALNLFFEAELDIARLYELGDGVPQDGRKAIVWYAAASIQGDAFAKAASNRGMPNWGKWYTPWPKLSGLQEALDCDSSTKTWFAKFRNDYPKKIFFDYSLTDVGQKADPTRRYRLALEPGATWIAPTTFALATQCGQDVTMWIDSVRFGQDEGPWFQ
jgi:TPR repeat protein